MGSAVVLPKGPAGAAVIGEFVLLRVPAPQAETSMHQNISIQVHKIFNELIKQLQGKFSSVLFLKSTHGRPI